MLKPKTFVPNHLGGFYTPFSQGNTAPFDDATLTGYRHRIASRWSRLLGPTLQHLLGTRYDGFTASLIDEKPMRAEDDWLVGEGVVPDTLGYRSAFFVFGRRGEVLAVIKSGRHGTTIERFGSLELLKDPALPHAYQEFIGIDE